MKFRVVRQFGANIDQQREDVYRVESVGMVTQREAVAEMRRLNGEHAEPEAEVRMCRCGHGWSRHSARAKNPCVDTRCQCMAFKLAGPTGATT